jgi:hypothetical protein
MVRRTSRRGRATDQKDTMLRKFVLLFALVALAGCGGNSSDSGSSGGTKPTETAPSPSAQNDKAIREAEQGKDNQAQMGAPAIRKTLRKELNLNSEDEFDLDGQMDEGQIGGDCYVKLGAEAANFEGQSQNILRSPNGADLIFVQSSTSAPLVGCLKAVRAALRW